MNQGSDSFMNLNMTNEGGHKSRSDSLFKQVKSRKDSLTYKSLQVYKIMYPYALLVALTYTIQYTFFPGVILTRKVSFISEFKWFAIGAIAC